ncbi:hypothetical protein KC19_9G015100 [Ceratodon purpureus]|uniref:Uncharacterized protein n=1 Tax=Ceratodon purpureus TaxID=3225 RepID=A0A8T0GQF9_CERPU|nr:hypothetical protein KC19_9G015100 [Ceratodon purpureus]
MGTPKAKPKILSYWRTNLSLLAPQTAFHDFKRIPWRVHRCHWNPAQLNSDQHQHEATLRQPLLNPRALFDQELLVLCQIGYIRSNSPPALAILDSCPHVFENMLTISPMSERIYFILSSKWETLNFCISTFLNSLPGSVANSTTNQSQCLKGLGNDQIREGSSNPLCALH